MERLRGMDATFLYMETPTAHMHVVGCLILDPSTAKGGYNVDNIIQLISERIHLLTPFRRRLIEVPFGLDHPRWIEDPDFDIENHITRVALPKPGGQRALETFVGQFASKGLDRGKPLWELVLVEGLEDGNVAMVTKMHHAAIDGVSGADLMVHLFDLEPTPAKPEPPTEEWVPDAIPSDLQLVLEGMVSQAGNPGRFVRQIAKTLGSVGDIVRQATGGSDTPLPFTAPTVPWNGALTPHRSVAFARTDLEDFKTIKNAYGCKINDVVLAATTESLRNYLQKHGGVPDAPLVASCPVSVRTDEEVGQINNRVSSMFVSLPVHIDDAAGQLEAVAETTKAAKELHQAMGADMLQDWAQVMTPGIMILGMRAYSRYQLANRHRPVHSLIVSNVPGPPIPLYSAGATVKATYPLGPLIEGSGLNLTVISNMGNLDAAVMACRELVDEPHAIADGFVDAVETLKASI